MSRATFDKDNNTLKDIEMYFLSHVVLEQKIRDVHTILTNISLGWTIDQPLMGDQYDEIIHQLMIIENVVTEIETLYSGSLPMTICSSRWSLLTLLQGLSRHAHEIILACIVYKQTSYHISIREMKRQEHMYNSFHKITLETDLALKAGSAWRDTMLERHVKFFGVA